MATGTNGIATISDLMTGKGLAPPPGPYDSNRCPIAYEISTMGGSAGGGYQANQLVKYSDVTKATVTYTLTIHTYYNNYYRIALFTNIGAPSVSHNSYYTYPKSVAPKYYITTFSAGSALGVNDMSANPVYVSIGNTYTVWGLLTSSSNWTKIATLTHVDGNKSQLI